MADVIFRGVKNPDNCSECFFWSICPCLADFDDYSAILDAVHDGNLVRHEECPVSPLPAGHGKMIDADALCRFVANNSRIDGIIAAGMISYINAAHTIVPAEGGTDDERVM